MTMILTADAVFKTVRLFVNDYQFYVLVSGSRLPCIKSYKDDLTVLLVWISVTDKYFV